MGAKMEVGQGHSQTSEQDEASFETRKARAATGGLGAGPPPPTQKILKSRGSEMLY